jgi:hypothetical protein
MPSRRILVILGSVLIALYGGTAIAKCDVVGNALPLALARDAIDAACPCAAAVKPSDHVKCAKPVVAARVATGLLDASCTSEALSHAKKSICGRPGAAVCCRVKTNGKTAHRVVKEPGKCVDTATLTSCVSVFPSVPSGCDASGCFTPVCGNLVVEPNESCDPPQDDVCDASCHLLTCDRPASSCGNGVLDPGEGCEPAGAGACGWDCVATTCAPPDAGELAVACSTEPAATVAVGARSGEYLVAWNDVPTWRSHPDVVARRLDPEGAPVDATPTVVSTGVDCGASQRSPSIGSDAHGYVIGWTGAGPNGFSFYVAIYTRSYDATATLGSLDQLVRRDPFGMCQSSVYAPVGVAPAPVAGADAFAVVWTDYAACVFGPSLQDPGGVLLDYTVDPPARTNMTIGYDLPSHPLPQPLGDGGAGIATLGVHTLAAMHAHIQNSSPPYASGDFVSGEWLAADGTTTNFTLSSRAPGSGYGLQPSVAAGATSFLVTWGEGTMVDATDIRAMRILPAATHGLDPAGGILLATTVGGAPVIGGPVAAFDGTRWLVVWTEAAAGGNDLRAVAVATDGTVLDAVPRLLASGVSSAAPALASAGDGRSLVLYTKADGGKSAIRARLVPGT